MSGIDARLRAWLVWLLPFAAVLALLGWETDWGRILRPSPPPASAVTPQPLGVELLPEFRIEGGLAERKETVERTLFNPTRRPAPPQAVAAQTPTIQRGQFVLTGTTVVDKKATAFLREVSGGRARRVQQGETINGMLVAEVRPDRVKLTLGGESEELVLKIATGPRTTIQPAPAAPAPAAPQPGIQPPGGAQGQPPQAAAVPQTPVAQDVADVLANRRRAARAAAAAAASSQGQENPALPPPAAPAPAAQAAPATPATPATPDPAWNEVYRRYMEPRR